MLFVQKETMTVILTVKQEEKAIFNLLLNSTCFFSIFPLYSFHFLSCFQHWTGSPYKILFISLIQGICPLFINCHHQIHVLNLKTIRPNKIKFGERSLRALGLKLWNNLHGITACQVC